jgi:hypothetical protein
MSMKAVTARIRGRVSAKQARAVKQKKDSTRRMIVCTTGVVETWLS